MGLFSTIAKQLRAFSFLLAEKPVTQVDENHLEHLLIYHGLVGTQEERQRQLADVKTDIVNALAEDNSHALAVALKLPPLWWEEKLKSIFASLSQDEKAKAIAVLLPKQKGVEELPESADPLRHEDWRVRANAAYLLSLLGADAAQVRIIDSLKNSADLELPAFPYLAQALASFKNELSQQTLLPYLYHEQSWYRVDATRALSSFDDENTRDELFKAMLSYHLFSDYSAVILARRFKISDIIADKNETASQGALEVIINTVAAAKQSFPASTIYDTGLDKAIAKCRKSCLDLPVETVSPRLLEAALCEADTTTQSELIKRFGQEKYNTILLNILSDYKSDPATRHALSLIGKLQVKAAAPQLLTILNTNNPYLEQVITCLGELRNPEAAPKLIDFARQLVDLSERSLRPASKQPVFEEEASKYYWQILKSLAKLPCFESFEFLLASTSDFAPDKRGQAFESLAESCEGMSLPQETKSKVQEACLRGLADQAASVRASCLKLIAAQNLRELIPQVIGQTDQSEVSLRNQAFACLGKLAANGHKEAVSEALAGKLKKELDQYKRERLQKCLGDL